MTPPITEHVEILFSAFGFVAAMTVFAWGLGFFRLPQKEAESQVSIWSTLGVFAVYFFVQLLFVPVIVSTYLYMTQGKLPENLGSVLTRADVGWISFVSILSSTIAVLIYSIFFGVLCGIREIIPVSRRLKLS